MPKSGSRRVKLIEWNHDLHLELREELIYLAGLFDGEGCISMTLSYYKATCGHNYGIRGSVEMTDRTIPETFKNLFGGSIAAESRSLKSEKHSDRYKWLAAGANAYFFFTALLPYVRLKRTEMEIAIRALKLWAQYAHHPKLEEYRIKLHELKGRSGTRGGIRVHKIKKTWQNTLPLEGLIDG